MTFRVPTASEIERRIILRMQGQQIALTDLTPISTLRIMLREMVVEELARLWAALAIEVDQWFLQTATGANLTRRMSDFGFVSPGAQSATGTISVTNISGSPVTLQAGTLATTDATALVPSKAFAVAANPSGTEGAWTIGAYATVRVPITAVDPGEAGNVPANSITNLAASSLACTNEFAVISGQADPDDDRLRELFKVYLSSLSGATRGAIVWGLLSYVDATGRRPVYSVALEEWDGTTLLDPGLAALAVWVDDGSGNPDGNAGVLEQVTRLIDGADSEDDPGLRGAGLRVEVKAAQPRPVDVIVSCDISRDVSATQMQASIRYAIERFLARIPVRGTTITGAAQGTMSFSQLSHAVTSVPGVLRAEFVAPTTNLLLPVGHKAWPGTINVTVQVVD